jgi:hypothetical protein
MNPIRTLIVCGKDHIDYWKDNAESVGKFDIRDITTLEDAYRMSGRGYVAIIYDRQVPPDVRNYLNASIRYAG